MIGAPNTQTLKCKVRVMKGAPDTSASTEIVDIFRIYHIGMIQYGTILNDTMRFSGEM